MTSYLITSLIVLSVMGLLNSGYLVYKHYQKNKPFMCPLNHDCGKVTESKWSRIFFVRNEYLGTLFFIGMLSLIILYKTNAVLPISTLILILIGAAVGLLFSVILVLIQAFIIKDYCFYCIISAIITLLIFLNSILLYKQ